MDAVRQAPSQGLVTVAWETTRSCPLRCLHCRADAVTRRHPDELTLAEGIRLIHEVAEAGAKVLVITGGDPLARPDVFDLIAEAASCGLHVGFSPSATPRLNMRALDKAVQAGASTIHLSLDGASSGVHDAFRGVPGSFDRTLAGFGAVAGLGARLQVGTTVCRQTVGELPAIASLLTGIADVWTLFFLVATGRARADDEITPSEQERVLHWLADGHHPYQLRTVEAPEFRRILSEHGEQRVAGSGVGDGRGFCFVSHVGDVCPSGFLQIPVGNVRDKPLGYHYENAPLMRALRDQASFGGRCGVCPWWPTCGGSRARAWASSGDPLAEDPGCGYEPPAWAMAAPPATTGREIDLDMTPGVANGGTALASPVRT